MYVIRTKDSVKITSGKVNLVPMVGLLLVCEERLEGKKGKIPGFIGPLIRAEGYFEVSILSSYLDPKSLSAANVRMYECVCACK